MKVLKILGITAGALIAAGIIMNFSDFRRYLKIEMM